MTRNTSPLPKRNAQRGVAAIEFALILPVLLLLVLGGVEITRYVLVNQKVDNAASSIASVITQVKDPKDYNFAQLYTNLASLLQPYQNSPYSMIISGIQSPRGNGATTVVWQWKSPGAGLGNSTVGSLNGAANIDPIQLPQADTLVSVEIYYQHHNILGTLGLDNYESVNAINNKVLYKKAIYRVRVAPFGTRVYNPSANPCGSPKQPACNGPGPQKPPGGGPTSPTSCATPTCACSFKYCTGA